MIKCTEAITLRWNFFISNSSTDLTVLVKIATQWSLLFFFLHSSWLMPSCIHRDRELHRDQNHNINYRKTCITAQILATFLLGKLNLNYKMNIVKQDSKFAKKKRRWFMHCRQANVQNWLLYVVIQFSSANNNLSFWKLTISVAERQKVSES